jgi:hypothetical protein
MLSLFKILYSSLEHVIKSSELAVFYQSSGNGFQRRAFSLLLVLELNPCLS